MTGPAAVASWTVERTADARFPFRISVTQGDHLLVAVRAQSPWPGPGQQIFCLREWMLDPSDVLEPVERVPVRHLARVGRKLAITLDRPTRKRCEFLTVTKPRKDGQGTYEQIFFRTESGIRSHRSRTRLELREAPAALTVAIDSGERYPWRFAGATIVRRRLDLGDYALLLDDRPAAVVERKSFENFLADLGAIQAFHHQCASLAALHRAAVVVEAQFGDFLNPRRLAGRWPPVFLARALAELHALHPNLPVIYAGNRKLANLWTQEFFTAVASDRESRQLELGEGVASAPRGQPPEYRGLDERIRAAALEGEKGPYATADLLARFPEVPAARIRRVLQGLRAEGRLGSVGKGPGLRWTTPG